MTPQEQQMIDGLISRICSTEVQDKDTAAEQHIQQGLSGHPDALYVLVQTVLVQQYGLEQAQAQLSELKQQNQQLQDQLQQAQQQKSPGGSFLSHIFGSGNDQLAKPQQQQQNPTYQPVNNPGYGSQTYPTGAYPPPPPPYQQGYPPPAGGGMFGGGNGGGLLGGGGGGFMRGALQTAAGVAAGEMVFRGMEDLFSGFGGHGERGFSQGGGETVINNYYDDDSSGGNRLADRSDDSGFYNPGHDASRDLNSDTGRGFADSGDTQGLSGSSDDLSLDDSGFDSSGTDDFSGGDDFSGDNS